MENMTAMFLHGVTSMERHGRDSRGHITKLPETGHDLLTKWQGAIFHPTPVLVRKGPKLENLEKHDFSDFPRFRSKISQPSISSLVTS
jgi:hypothetical protein